MIVSQCRISYGLNHGMLSSCSHFYLQSVAQNYYNLRALAKQFKMEQKYKLIAAIQQVDNLFKLTKDNISQNYIAFHLSSIRSDLVAQLTELTDGSSIVEFITEEKV